MSAHGGHQDGRDGVPPPAAAALALTATLLWGGCGDDDRRDHERGADSGAAGGAGGRAGDEPDPVPWSVATDVVAARRGEYRQVLTTGTASRTVPAIEEWVTYDHDVPFVDRRIVWRIDTTTGEPTEGVSRENPTLRAVTTGTATYVSGARVEERCGTTWAEATPDQASAMTGAPVDSFRADPTDALDTTAPTDAAPLGSCDLLPPGG
jgi:hypothetical protein